MEESPYVMVVREEFHNLRQNIADHESKLEQNLIEILAKVPAPVPYDLPRNHLHAEELRQLRLSARESSGKIKLLQYQLAKAKPPAPPQEDPLAPMFNEDCSKLLHFHRLHSVLQELKSHAAVSSMPTQPLMTSSTHQSPPKSENTMSSDSSLQFSPASFSTASTANNGSFLPVAFQRKVFTSALNSASKDTADSDENEDQNKNRSSSTFTFDLQDESLVPPSQMKMLFRAFQSTSHSSNNSINESHLMNSESKSKSKIIEHVRTPAHHSSRTNYMRSTPLTGTAKKLVHLDSGSKSLRTMYSRATELDSFLLDDNSSIEDLELSCHTLNTTFDLCHNLGTAGWMPYEAVNDDHRDSLSRGSHSTAWARPLRQSYSRATL